LLNELYDMMRTAPWNPASYIRAHRRERAWLTTFLAGGALCPDGLHGSPDARW